MHDVLREHIHANISLPNEDFTYGDGKKRLRAALSRFLTKHLKPVVPIQPEHIAVTNGCSSAIEHVAWAFGNPGDAFLLGRPYYGTFVPDITLRMGTDLATVDFDGLDPLSLGAVERYKAQVLKAQQRGQKVAGLILAHPHNPLGRCYSKEVIIELMKLCQQYGIHFISDEIYALSTFENKVDTGVEIHPFESVLSIDTTHIIDPALVHVIWGISKDFGANGLRMGTIISQHNSTLHAALVPVSLYSSSSSITDHVTANILEDETWVESYVEQNRRSLADSYEHVTSWARDQGVEYAAGVNAAFFLWVNLGAAYQKTQADVVGEDITQVIMDALLREKVFLASGVQFGSERPGWFRIVFSQERAYIDEGLRRIAAAIARR